MSNAVACYALTGNDFYGHAYSGFCGSLAGIFTVTLDDVTCPECRDIVADLRAA